MHPSEISQLIDSLQKRESEIVARVETWSNVNSGTDNSEGVAEMADLLQAELKLLTSDVERIVLPDVVEVDDLGNEVERPIGPALRAVLRPDAPVQVLLSGHLDTVFPADHPFQKVSRNGNRLIGPGVADMKGGLVVMLEALSVLENSPERDQMGWEVFLNPDEEIGSPRSAPYLREAAGRHQFGLAFEPALPDGNLVSGRWGTGNFTVRSEGKSAHVGRAFAEGRNGIVALAEWIREANALNHRNGVIVNIGRIVGGGALNIVPDRAACGLNVRVENEKRMHEIESELRAISLKTAREHDVKIDFQGTFGRPPKPVTPELEKMLNAFAICAQEIGFELGWRITGGGSDGNILASAGLPTVDSLGVRGGGIHTSSEFLEIDSLVERSALTGIFLIKAARGEIVF